jgi:WD40 repeat protein
MPCFSHEDFMREFVFPDEPARDFECAGIPAQYASGHPKDWSQACDVLNFSADLNEHSQSKHRSYYTAISSDKRLLAISTDAERILVYNIASRQLCEVLEGAGSVAFRPSDANEESLPDNDQAMGRGTPRPGYTLISSISDDAYRGGRRPNQLILWDLDQNGRILDKEEPIDSALLATKAIDAIAPDLAVSHEWTRDFINTSKLHTEFMKSLSKIAADHRRRHNIIIDNAELASFGSVNFSTDGKLLLYHSKNRSTQQSMRTSQNLPAVVIYDLEAGVEIHRLTGHTDAIMWSAISPNKERVATVSWDGTLRMYSVSTGALMWVTENSGGQSWAGAFS